MSNTSEPSVFSTTDIYLVAALSVVGRRPDTVTRANARMTFHWSTSVKDLVEQYYAGSLEVSARDYASEIKNFKTIIHNPTT